MKVSRVHGGVMLACLGLGCEDRWKDEYDFEWRGEYVTVYGYDRDQGQACGESLQATDDYVRMLLDFHGSEAAVHVDYRWLTRATWNDVGLPEVKGLYLEDEIFSIYLPHDHELSHAVSRSVNGRYCAAVLDEGLAIVLEDANTGHVDFGEWGFGVEELLVFSGAPSSEEYYRSGQFVAFLLESYGVDGFDGLCQSMPRKPSLGNWDAATRAVLGLSLDEVLAAFAAYPVCNHHQFRGRLRDCSGDPDVIVSATEMTEFSFRFACDEPDVLGVADGTMTLTRRVEIPVPGEYAIEVDDGSPAHERKVEAVHEQCATCSQAPLYGRIEDVPLHAEGELCIWVHSPTTCGYHQLADLHTFVFFLDEGLDRDVTVRIVPMDPELP